MLKAQCWQAHLIPRLNVFVHAGHEPQDLRAFSSVGLPGVFLHIYLTGNEKFSDSNGIARFPDE